MSPRRSVWSVVVFHELFQSVYFRCPRRIEPSNLRRPQRRRRWRRSPRRRIDHATVFHSWPRWRSLLIWKATILQFLDFRIHFLLIDHAAVAFPWRASGGSDDGGAVRAAASPDGAAASHGTTGAARRQRQHERSRWQPRIRRRYRRRRRDRGALLRTHDADFFKSKQDLFFFFS